MNNYNGSKHLNSTYKKSALLSGQKKISLKEVKELAEATNKAQQLYDALQEKRNVAITLYLNQNPKAAYSLAFELRIIPATIYNIFNRQTKQNKKIEQELKDFYSGKEQAK